MALVFCEFLGIGNVQLIDGGFIGDEFALHLSDFLEHFLVVLSQLFVLHLFFLKILAQAVCLHLHLSVLT